MTRSGQRASDRSAAVGYAAAVARGHRVHFDRLKRRKFIPLLGGAAGWPLATRAQSAGDGKRRVGVLMPSDPEDSFGKQSLAALAEGLRRLGWDDGRNLVLNVQWIGGDEGRRRALAGELVRHAPDVLFACFQAQLAALVRETHSIPIVFVGVSDPVGGGYVKSYARPGGNITGFTLYEPSMVGLWLSVLKEMVPALDRVALLFNPEATMQRREQYVQALKTAAAASRVEPLTATVTSVNDIAVTLANLAQQPRSGVIVMPDTFTAVHFKLIVEHAAQHRLPTVYQFRPPVEAGGLVSYGPKQLEIFRQSATYIDRILRGSAVADLPIQAPTKFELVINLKAAKALGLDLPSALLARADEVIE